MERNAELKRGLAGMASKALVGRTIKEVRYMTEKEQEAQGWYGSAVVLMLDNGVCVFPSRDDEGNDAGALFTTDKSMECVPVIMP